MGEPYAIEENPFLYKRLVIKKGLVTGSVSVNFIITIIITTWWWRKDVSEVITGGSVSVITRGVAQPPYGELSRPITAVIYPSTQSSLLSTLKSSSSWSMQPFILSDDALNCVPKYNMFVIDLVMTRWGRRRGNRYCDQNCKSLFSTPGIDIDIIIEEEVDHCHGDFADDVDVEEEEEGATCRVAVQQRDGAAQLICCSLPLKTTPSSFIPIHISSSSTYHPHPHQNFDQQYVIRW